MTSPSEQNPPPGDAEQALTDALLREHARLGSADDESLLAAVRARTVDRPVATRVVDLPASTLPRSRRRTSAREWMQLAAAVILAFGLVGLFLSRHSVNRETRSEQTFQLVSRPLTAIAVPSDSTGPNSRKPEPAAADLGASITLPDLAGSLPGSGDLVFGSNQTTTDPASEDLLARFSVSAEKILQVSPDRLVYEGGVILRHPEFTLRADRLELSRLGAEEESRVEAFVAEGSDLKVEKRASDGGVEIARATSATWDASQGGLVLAGGPPTLSAGASFVRPASTDGVIVLRTDGYQVIER